MSTSNTAPGLKQADFSNDPRPFQRVLERLSQGDQPRIQVTVIDAERLRWWNLGFRPRVRVFDLRSLRDEISRQHRQAAEAYGELMATRRRAKG